MRKVTYLCLLLAFVVLSGANVAGANPHSKKTPQKSSFPFQLKNKLVFTRDEPLADKYQTKKFVWTMNPDGSEQKRIWQVPKGYGAFGGFSSDGTQALSYNNFNLYVHNLKTGRLKRLFLHSSGWGTYISSPSFSSDAKRVVLVAGGALGTLNPHLYVIDPTKPPRTFKENGSLEVKRLQGIDGDMHDPSFSPDGRRLVVCIAYRVNAYPEEYASPWNIWTLNVDGSMPQQLTFNVDPLEWKNATKQLKSLDQNPCFSPDGKTIAFVRRVFQFPEISSDIWLVDANGQRPRRILTYVDEAKGKPMAKNSYGYSYEYNEIYRPIFDSSGRQLAFTQRIMGGEWAIYRIGVDEKSNNQPKPIRLTNGVLVQWF